VGSLEVSVATGASGPVLVLAGEADFTSITRLDEALTAQVSGRAVQLTIDAANLRYADSASMRTLVMAAMKARTRAGSVTLLDPQPAVARMLDLLCTGKSRSLPDNLIYRLTCRTGRLTRCALPGCSMTLLVVSRCPCWYPTGCHA
jgi:anti-anti-sigma factor